MKLLNFLKLFLIFDVVNAYIVDDYFAQFLSKTIVSIINEYYAVYTTRIFIIRATGSRDAHFNQTYIVNEVVKQSNKRITFNIGNESYVIAKNSNMSLYNIIFVDNYESYR